MSNTIGSGPIAVQYGTTAPRAQSFGDSLDDALRWVGAALREPDVKLSVDFGALDQPAQFLAIEALRITARSAMHDAELNPERFTTAVLDAFRRWLDGAFKAELGDSIDCSPTDGQFAREPLHRPAGGGASTNFYTWS